MVEDEAERAAAAAAASPGMKATMAATRKSGEKQGPLRAFTCTCESTSADLLFLSNNLVQPILKMHDI